jgi:hypothetical protein
MDINNQNNYNNEQSTSNLKDFKRISENSGKLDFNFIKKNFKLRKSQDKVDKYDKYDKQIRFNTEAYDKD